MVDKDKSSRAVSVGSVKIGGRAPVSVQGMTKTKTADYKATLKQLRRLESAGAEIIRMAIRDEGDLVSFRRLKKIAGVPLVADIHFRSDLAIGAISAGADKVRLNPGNISEPKKLREIIRTAKKAGIAIRIGVNAGSLKSSLSLYSVSRDGFPLTTRGNDRGQARGNDMEVERLAEKMVSAAGDYISLFEREGFPNLIVSLKASTVRTTILANRLFRRQFDYPLHLGITEAGRGSLAVIKSALGIGSLLQEGIGDTIRVSLSEPPEEEVEIGRKILQSLGLRHFYPEVISCPTCGRSQIDLFAVLDKVESGMRRLPGYPERYAGLKIAVMGCEVNGPGEASSADIGIAGGRGMGLLFSRGKVIAKVPETGLAGRLLQELKKFHTRRDR
ncbi:MAG: flavodoxin-dependent (E)-4-hydroxy-3-methylbut-2-enyl-diphosphate synthase [Candidatus Omnitrophota bacterium]